MYQTTIQAPPTRPPLYEEATEAAVEWALQRYQAGTRLYDLGCATGVMLGRIAAGLSLRQQAGRLVGVDASEEMLARAEELLLPWLAEHEISLRCEPVEAAEVNHASVVLCNYLLPFVARAERTPLLAKIHAGLLPGGMLFLSDVIGRPLSATAPGEAFGPLSYDEEIAMLGEVGFTRIEPLIKWNDFVSFVAIK